MFWPLIVIPRTERKIEDVRGEDQFGFRRGKGQRDAIAVLKMSYRTMDIREGLCVCFMDWHEAFYRVYWTQLIHILNHTCTHWREGSVISKLYMDHNLHVCTVHQ
jgi:hypothetical protein